MAAKWQRFRVSIPKKYNPRERKAIAAEIIDFITERTESGKDKNNKNFKRYTPEYVDSQNFELAGKNEGDINLTLTGETLNELDRISDKSGTILIGYDKADKDLNGKVEGNRIGSYGKKAADPKKARDFLGISERDLSRILKKFPKETEAEKRRTTERAIDILTALRIGREIAGDVQNGG